MALTVKHRRMGMWRAFGAALVLGTLLQLPFAPAFACAVPSYFTSIEQQLRKDAAFVGIVDRYELVTPDVLSTYQYGILYVRVEKVVKGDLREGQEIILHYSADGFVPKRNIFFVYDMVKRQKWRDSQHPHERGFVDDLWYDFDDIWYAFRKFGEPQSKWYLTLDNSCGPGSTFRYDDELLNEISKIDKVGYYNTEEFLEPKAASDTEIRQQPIRSDTEIVKPTHRHTIAWYLKLALLILLAGSAFWYLIRRRKLRPA